MPRTRTCARGWTLAALLALLAAPAAAQNSTIEVSGTISDASRAALSDARIEALVAGRIVARASSDQEGRYRVRVPANAPFELRVRRDGFADAATVVNGAATDLRRDVVMQVGSVSDTVVVTASRGAQGRAGVTTATTVVTREDFHAMGASQLSDALRFVPGLALDSTGREGGLTSLFARGGESDYNLVLVDGVRMNVQGGGFDFSRIDANEIERVEVVRGAQSSLWGSDAIGSVVQVFTRRAAAGDRPRVSGSFEGGSFSTWRTAARITGTHRQSVDYHAGASARGTDGAFADLLPEDDRFEQVSGDAGAGVALGGRASLRGAVRYSRAQGRGVSNITYGARDTGGEYDTKSLSLNVDLSHTAGSRFAGSATFNYFRYSAVSADTVADPPFDTYAVLEGTPGAFFPNGVRLVRLVDEAEYAALVAAGAAPGPGQFLAAATSFDFPFNINRDPVRFRRPAVRYQGDYAWGAGQRFSAGYEWERESVPFDGRDALSTGIDLDDHSVFVQHQASFADRLFVTAGARLDRREAYDSFVSPRLSAGGFIVPFRAGALSSLKVFANLGRGHKAPTFGERFGDQFGDGNPGLKVERARTADVGVEATAASQTIRASAIYFDNSYRDQIAYRFGPVGDGIPENINIDGSEANGWELEAALQRPVGGVTASATYTYVDSRVVTTISTSEQFQPGQPLFRRPRHSGAFRAAWSHDRATVHVDLRLVGERHDSSFLFLQTEPNAQYPESFTTDITVNPGYTVAGVGLDVRVERGLTLYVRGGNITDERYDSALGYPGNPRSFMVGLMVDVGR